MLKIGFIGAGTVGTALAVRLGEKGYPVTAVASRTRASAERLAGMVHNCEVYDSSQKVADVAELVFITTPDDHIEETCEAIAGEGGFSQRDLVLHCSGAMTADDLKAARKYGAFVASMHPMGVFADVDDAVNHLSELSF